MCASFGTSWFPLQVCQNKNVHTCNSVRYSDVNVGIPTISKQHVLLQRPNIETHSFLNDVLLFKSVSFPLFVYVFVLCLICFFVFVFVVVVVIFSPILFCFNKLPTLPQSKYTYMLQLK